ncbi:MAG TPA: hypothetical protein VHY08_12905 [Bacillota bacterium]|nr:hypothetical protein [Bacillota bacterium]
MKENLRSGNRLIYVSVFAISMVTLLFEIAVTRIFSVLLWYHFVFIVVSVSILGLGLGGLLIHWLMKKNRISNWDGFLAVSAIIFGLSIPISLILLLLYPFPSVWSGYLVISVLPFIAGGVFMAAIFHRYTEFISKLYFADLTGAALGSIGTLLILNFLTPIQLIFFLGSIGAIIGVLFAVKSGAPNLCGLGVTLTLLLTVIGIVNIQTGWFQINYRNSSNDNKTLFGFMNDSENGAKIAKTRWDSFSRVDLGESKAGNSKILFTDGGAASEMIKFNGDFNSVSYLKQDPGYYPLTWGTKDNVLIIGSGGGKDVLMALMAGSGWIDAVEINQQVARLVKEYSSYNGGIFNRKNVRFMVEDGRSFIERSSKKYDLIYLPLVFTQAAEATGYSLAENYVFTTEAFQSYFNHLAPGGRLVLKMHSDFDSTKVIFTAVEILKKQGLSNKEAFERIMIYDMGGHDQQGTHFPVIVISKDKFSPKALDPVHQELMATKRLIYMPYYHEYGTLAALADNQNLIQRVLNLAPVQLKPASDDKPFFYNEEKGVPKNLFQLFSFVVGFIGVFSIMVYDNRRNRNQIKPFKKSKTPRYQFGLPRFYVYFALIGTAFMMVEVGLIQKYLLVLGQPTYSISLILLGLLSAGGLGSFTLSYLKPERKEAVFRRIGWIVGLIIMVYAFSLPAFTGAIIQLDGLFRLSLTLVSVLPLGFFMGMVFPLGLQLLKQERPDDVALMWAVNGVYSVLGSVAAVAIAMTVGFQVVLIIAGVVYLLLAVLVRSYPKGNIFPVNA